MAPTPSSSTSLAVQAMAMRAAQRLTGLLSVSLFLQTAFVCDPRRRVVLIFVCVGVVTACCSDIWGWAMIGRARVLCF